MTGNEHRPSRDFGSDLTPPADYDPFEARLRIARADEAGPVDPLLAPHVSRPVVDGPPPRLPFWDRPKPKKDWYWVLGRIGGALITLGLLMLLFVGYQLWGTGIEEAQSQNRLEDQFAQLAATTVTTVTSSPTMSPTTSPQTSPTTSPPVPQPVVITEGDPIAIIEMPTIGVSKYVVAGIGTSDLKKGPGHFPSTPFPGELGNAAIAGHRTTYGEPFRHLDDLAIGDEIRITDLLGRVFVYRVSQQMVVDPSDSWVVATDDDTRAILTLTTCHPEFSARNRLIVTAELDLTQSTPAPSRAAEYAGPDGAGSPSTTTSVADTTPPTTVTPTLPADQSDQSDQEHTSSDDSGDGFEDGWFSNSAAWPHVLFWAVLDLAIVWGAWQVAKRYRNRIIGAAIGLGPFLVVLYFVFQNVNRLLPPNL